MSRLRTTASRWGSVVVDVATPGLPSCLVALEGFPGRVRVEVHERFAIGHGHHAGERPVGGDGDSCGLPRLDGRGGVVRSATARRRPVADQDLASVLGPRWSAPLSESRVEVDDGLDRAVGGGQSAHQHGGGEQPAADLGHHALGEGQPTGVGLPGRLEGGGVGAVAASHYLGGVCGGKSEASRGRSADQLAEHRLTVEARDAQPVDGTVGADQRGRAGVAEQPVVLDRDLIAAPPHRAPRRRPRAVP